MVYKPLLTASLAGALAFGAAGLPIHAEPSLTEKAMEYRQGLMEVFAWNLSSMGGVVKGEVTYDKAEFERHAQDLAAATKLDLLKGFPDDSVGDESDAKDEIWLQWTEFTDKFRNLQEQSAQLAAIAASGDLEQIEPQFKQTADACKGCHRDFKK